MDEIVWTLAVAALLAGGHVCAGWLDRVATLPRRYWLSLASGISVAYVFVGVFPELARGQVAVESEGILAVLEHHVYLAALVGFSLFYGWNVGSRERPGSRWRRRARRRPWWFRRWISGCTLEPLLSTTR